MGRQEGGCNENKKCVFKVFGSGGHDLGETIYSDYEYLKTSTHLTYRQENNKPVHLFQL